MEVREVMGNMGNSVTLGGELLEQHIECIGQSEDLGVDILEDFDSYMEDIDGRLTISRMVSMSVIKGMVEAVEKMAEEKIAENDSEVARMRERVHYLESGGDGRVGISEVPYGRDGLDSLFALNLEEISRFRQIGDEISERINEVSDARNELDLLLKSLPGSGSGQLMSQGSQDMDNFYRKLLNSQVSTPDSFSEENDHLQVSKNGMPDTWDVVQLGHLKREGLVDHFNSIITKMKRDHETQVQKITEDYFMLKREYLKEKGYSVHHRKDKNLEAVRKKIAHVILKLDDIIAENKKLSTFSKNADTFTCLKDRVNGLLLENLQLRVSLSDKEIKILNLQVSDASEKLLQHSLDEENLKFFTDDLKSAANDADIEKFLVHEIYECVMKGLALSRSSEEPEILCIGAAQDAQNTNKCQIEDSDIKSLISEGVCGVTFREALRDAKVIVDDMTNNYMHECDSRFALEKKALEKDEELRLLIEERERLKREVDSVVAAFEEEKNSSLELSAALMKERDQLELALYEFNSIKSRVGWLESSLTERDQELDLMKGKFAEALEHVELGKLDLNKTMRKLEIVSEQLRVANEEGNEFHAIAQKNQNFLVMLEAKKDEQRRQLQSVVDLIYGLSREFFEFECRIFEDIKQQSSRLEEFSSVLQSLFKKTNVLRKAASVYKQKLERKCVDLETAETEVDLLGDQVDTLVNLLEKIYIAIDHYSPILQHYPGIMEILKLVRRELSGESVKFK